MIHLMASPDGLGYEVHSGSVLDCDQCQEIHGKVGE